MEFTVRLGQAEVLELKLGLGFGNRLNSIILPKFLGLNEKNHIYSISGEIRGNVYFAPLSSTALSILIPIAALTQSA